MYYHWPIFTTRTVQDIMKKGFQQLKASHVQSKYEDIANT